jgi:hypothetical protein
MRIALALLLLTWLALPAAARSGMANSLKQGDRAEKSHDEILLADGTLLAGHIVAENDSVVILETPSLGSVNVERSQIQAIHRAGERFGVLRDPDDNSILLVPTPATVGRGSGYFRSFELLILNAGFGITDRLDLSLGTLFPISGEWNFLALGVKLALIDRERQPLGLALTGSHLIAPDEQRFSTVGGVVGIGNARRSLNLALDYGVDEDGEHGTRVMLGGDLQTNRRSKVFAEWANSELVFTGGDDDDDFNGFITFGIRLFSENMAFTLGGFRPLADTGSFIVLPLIMFSAH